MKGFNYPLMFIHFLEDQVQFYGIVPVAAWAKIRNWCHFNETL